MSKYDRGRRPYVKPVTKIELSEKHTKLRWIAVIVLLSIGAVAIGMSLFSALNTQPGWQEIEVVSDRPNCSTEFTFLYDFSDYGNSATAANKTLVKVYSTATEEAHCIFSKDMEDAGIANLYYVNANPNKTVQVEPALYQAFSLLESYGSRHIYLAPVYVEYSRIFRSESDVEAASFDPSRNREVREEIGVLASYANDPHMIQIKLLGDNQIMLHISDEYLAYAEENGIDQFLDFGWMRNAFIADYIADSLINAGFTSGYIASFDGFTCNLDQRGEVYTFNLFDAVGQDVYMPGQMQYTSARSIVFLRNYPMDELDRWTYYVYEDGQVTGTIVNPANGMSQTSLNNMVSYADDAGCAKVLMEMLPVFTAEVFSASAAENMAKNGVYSIWYEDAVVIYNDASLDLMLLPDTDGNLYEMKLAQ